MSRLDRRQKPDFISRIARERIEILLSLAGKAAKTNPTRARRYVLLARKIGTRYLIRLPRSVKLSFCKECSSPLIPGYNLKIRLNSRHKMVEYACNCGEVKRVSYHRKA